MEWILDDLTLQQARRRLLRWYRRSRRDLPWRRTHDPYHIWVSEIMLQQTRVEVVVPHYERFLRRFPSVRALAAAPLDDVLHAWSGLGYYRRARHLHAAARCVVSDFEGQLPEEVTLLQRLPGVGAYTAGAISSLAFERQAPILDGNIQRLFARLLAWEEEIERAPSRREFWNLAARWVRSRSPAEVNQSLMELGATVCTPSAPDCPRCPLRATCRAHALGLAGELPRSRRRAPLRTLRLAAILLASGEALLLVRRCSGRLLEDWWELPTLRLDEGFGVAHVRRVFQQRAGFDANSLRRLPANGRGPLRHGILSHRIEIEVYQGRMPRRQLPRRAKASAIVTPGATPVANLELQELEWRWTSMVERRRLPLSTLARKVLAAHGSTSTDGKSQRRGDEETP